MSSPEESPGNLAKAQFGIFPTGIDTLDHVLRGGIRCLPNLGMLGVIAGASGAGKSILALQMCCAFLHDRWKPDATKPYSAVYITHEEPALIEAKIVDFTYFTPGQPPDSSPASPILIVRDQLHPLMQPRSEPTLHVCRVPLAEEQQGRVLQNVFDTISQRIRCLKPKDGNDEGTRDPMGNILVCVDNVRTIRNEALLAAMSSLAGNPTKERTPDVDSVNFYKELHRACVEGHVHTFLVMEEDIPEGVDPARYEISNRPEVFAADIVIRLGIRTYSTEYRERFIQIVKAKHQFYFRGKHHFSIVSGHGGGRLQEKRRGIVVYPSIPMQLSLLKKNENRHDGNTQRLTLGIPLLDKKIEEAIPLRDADSHGYIRPCTNSVLVCDLDAMATIIGLHFALKGGLQSGASADGRGIVISFKHKHADIRGIAERFFSGEIDGKLGIHDFPPEYISGHKLLRDITELITETQETLSDKPEPLRVVLDNVFELQCKYPLITDTRGFLASLLEMFSAKGVTSLLIDTVEVGEGRNPIESSFAAGLADNVFLLRHVEFHSQPHRVFSVLKLIDLHTPDNLWDLEEVRPPEDDRYELHAGDTFALYKNVLTGRPEPITITFSLYNDEENSPFHTYLQGQIESLRHSFGESLNVNLYGAEEYSRVQNLLAAAERLPRGDCHIVALDEFWLRQLIQKERLEDLTGPIAKLPPGERLVAEKGDYVCAAHDIALHQLDKPYDKWYAIPARNNCGILCFDRETVRKRYGKALPADVKAWLDDPQASTIHWDSLVDLKCGRRADPREAKQSNDQGQRMPQTFFTFCMDQIESCVSFLLELALAYDTGDKFLVPHKRENKGKKEFHLALNMSKFPSEALMTLAGLLDAPELRQLASATFRPSADEPPALFTRQWMSTLGCLKARAAFSESDYGDYFQKLEPHELPMGPCDHPTPVSGTWYLGILKGSIAVDTGVKLIGQFTSPGDELYKLSNYIGLPVRRGFYEGQGSYDLPYRERFVELADIQKRLICSPTDPDALAAYERAILDQKYPLYRMLIEEYENIAPILWRLIVKIARAALGPQFSRDSSGPLRTNEEFKEEICRLITVAGNEYKAIPR